MCPCLWSFLLCKRNCICTSGVQGFCFGGMAEKCRGLFNIAVMAYGIFVLTNLFGFAPEEISALTLVVFLMHFVMLILPHTFIKIFLGPVYLVAYLLLLFLHVVLILVCLPCIIIRDNLKKQNEEDNIIEEVPVQHFG